MPAGVLALLASGMALGFFVAAIFLLGHYQRQTGSAFSQADPRWRFQSVFGALMLFCGLVCFAFGLYALSPRTGGESVGRSAVGVELILSGGKSWAWLAFALGMVPIPVVALELVLSRWFQQVGFTRHYETNARNWPITGWLIRQSRRPDAKRLWRNILFFASWIGIYFITPIFNLGLLGHFSANRERLKERKEDRRLQMVVDALVGFTVLLSLTVLVFTALTALGVLPPSNDFANRLLTAFLFLVVVTAFVAVSILLAPAIRSPKSRRLTEALLAMLFVAIYAPATWFDLLGNSFGKLPVWMQWFIPWFGGATPVPLVLLSILLVVLFINDLNAANTRHLTQVKESVNQNAMDMFVHVFNNKIYPPLGLVSNINTILRDRPDLWRDDSRSLLIAAADDAQAALTQLQSHFSEFKARSLAESVPAWYELDDLLKEHVGARARGLRVDTESPVSWRFRLNVRAREFSQALSNLLENAEHAMTQAKTDHPSLRILVRHDRQSMAPLTISVADNGPGVPNDLRDKVFQSHFTTKVHGTGIGLYQVRSFMDQLGGSVTLDSRPGQTVFTLHFPQEVVDTERRSADRLLRRMLSNNNNN